jgi:hypothetical protein
MKTNSKLFARNKGLLVRILVIGIFIVTVALMISCEKDSQAITNTCKVLNLQGGDGKSTQEYLYDDSKKLIRINYYSGETLNEYETFSYDSKNRLSKKVFVNSLYSYETYTDTFTYGSNSMVVHQNGGESGYGSFTSTATLNSNGEPINLVSDYNGGITIEYIWGNGNISRMVIKNNLYNTNNDTIQFEYSDTQNPFQSIFSNKIYSILYPYFVDNPCQFLTLNCPSKITESNFEGSGEIRVTNFTYTTVENRLRSVTRKVDIYTDPLILNVNYSCD